jgi:hypothetical protein
MKIERFEIGGTLAFESTKYETASFNDACFEFVEHSTDHWSSDRNTSVTVDAVMARKIIDALNQHFEF